MIGRMAYLAEPGQFIKWRGHNVSDALYLRWWKVTDVADGVIHMIDRSGSKARMNVDHAGRLRWKIMVWEPGDDRADETA